MPSFECKGVLIDFPYEPYEVQKRYIEKVLECLQNVNIYIIKYLFNVFFCLYIVLYFLYVFFRAPMVFWSLLQGQEKLYL